VLSLRHKRTQYLSSKAELKVNVAEMQKLSNSGCAFDYLAPLHIASSVYLPSRTTPVCQFYISSMGPSPTCYTKKDSPPPETYLCPKDAKTNSDGINSDPSQQQHPAAACMTKSIIYCTKQKLADSVVDSFFL
jgi:hypothetical protein